MMRSERRLTRLEGQIQDAADRRVERLLSDLDQWSEADLNAALRVAYQCDPRFVNNPGEVERLFSPGNEAALQQLMSDDLAQDRQQEAQDRERRRQKARRRA